MNTWIHEYSPYGKYSAFSRGTVTLMSISSPIKAYRYTMKSNYFNNVVNSEYSRKNDGHIEYGTAGFRTK